MNQRNHGTASIVDGLGAMMSADDLIKIGVDLRVLAAQWGLAYPMIQHIFHSRGYSCVVTSGNDSHAGKPNSLHHTGQALDFRTRHLAVMDKIPIRDAIKISLGAQWDVVLENVGLDNEHVHVEFDPKDNP